VGSRVELFGQIRRDKDREDLSERALAARYRVGRATVRQALASPVPPPRKRPENRPVNRAGFDGGSGVLWLGQGLVGLAGSVVVVELGCDVVGLMLLSVSHCSVSPGGVLGQRSAGGQGRSGRRRTLEKRLGRDLALDRAEVRLWEGFCGPGNRPRDR